MKVDPTWHVVDGYCVCLIRAGGDVNKVADRLAFIEKTPRVRIRSYTSKEDWLNWAQGDKGRGPDDDESREWCLKMLALMGWS